MKVLLILVLCQFSAAPVKAQTVADFQNSGDSLCQISENLWQQGDTLGANREMERSIATFYQINSGDNINFVSAEYIHAVRLNLQNNNHEALHLLEDADIRVKKLIPMITELSCLIEYSLAQTYKDTERYEDAIRIGEKMKRDYGMFYGVTSEKYLEALHLLSLIYYSSKKYPLCKDVTTEFLGRSIREGFFDKNNFSYCYSFARLAESESVLGNCQEAEEYYHIADTLLAKIDGIDNIRALLLNRRAVNLTQLGYVELADSCLSAAFDLNGESIVNIVMATNNQYAMRIDENPSLAYDMFSYLTYYLEENGYQSSPLYAIVRSNVAYSCLQLGKTDEGISHIEPAVSILSNNSDFIDNNYFISLQTRILLYTQKHDLRMVEKYSEELSREIKRHLRDVFPYLTERQRMDFWDQLSGWAGFTLPCLTVEYKTKKLRNECYNAILQSRGILLNSTLNIDRILRNTEDVSLKELYQQWKTAKKKKMETYVIEGLERKILEVLPSHGDFLADMNINTDSIKRHLNDKEIAIEFFSLLDPEIEDTIYVALSLKKGYHEPHLTMLCRSGELSTILSESFCNSRLYKLFWQQLKDEMKSVRRVFFAVDGILHNIPIEYCPDEKGLSVFEKYECYRVSSTREIVKNKGKRGGFQTLNYNEFLAQGKVVLYGDINYNAYGSQDDNQDENMDIGISYEDIYELGDTVCLDTKEVLSKGYRSLVRGERFALQSFKLLDGTKREILSIEKTLRNNGIIPVVQTKEKATEETVYNLIKIQPHWLHFATHGYYEREDVATEYGLMADVEGIVDSREAMALSRTALVLSGANNWIESGVKSRDGHDGLLTAYEISSQDFSNVDMVVMSACESGLGDIGSEGVFGLQRGMKKAGVKSVLMSLCKVDDDAATQFMTTFYTELLDKHDKLRALSEAQKVVREVNNGIWSSPKFWASFILLDGF